MDCKKVQRRLTEYVCEDLLPRESRQIQEHIDSCESCRREMQSIERTRTLLSKWDDAEVPGELHSKLLALKSKRRKGLLSFIPANVMDFLWSSAFPTAAGFATAVVVLVFTFSYLDNEYISNWSLLLCGLVWGEVYSSIFQKMFAPFSSKSRFSSGNSKFILAGLLCFLFSFVLAAITPNPMPFETRAFFFPIAKLLPYGFAYVLPFIWSLVGVSATVWFLQRKAICPFSKLWIMAGIYAMLMSLDLVTYVIFDPFATWELLLIWIGGVAVGSVIGIFAGRMLPRFIGRK